MNYTQSKGNIIELQCISKCIELGYECSIPYGNGAKYDFIVDVNGKLLRIQCKSCINPINKSTGELDDAIQIITVCQTTNTKKTVRHTYTKEQIDYFATYYNGQVYFIPVEECSTSKTLRFSPPRSGCQNYNKAEDYKIENFISVEEKYQEERKVFEEEQKNKLQQVKEKIKEYKCSICRTPITKYAKTGMCPSCNAKNSRQVKRPSREELKQLIRVESFTRIGEKFGVSDNSIRKWCIFYDLPSRKKDINEYSDEDWNKI